MPRNPLEFAQKEALRNDAFLRKSFDKFLGSSIHPRGQVLSVYRRGRAQMSSALNANKSSIPLLARDVLTQMRRELAEIARNSTIEAGQQGIDSAQKQAEAYNNAGSNFAAAGQLPDVSPMANGLLFQFDGQERAVMSMIRSGRPDKKRIVGDGGRLGVLQPAPVITAGAEFIAAALTAGLLAWWIGQDEKPRQDNFKKQAIAVVDEKTTDCCLKVNGQVRPFNKPFTLTGTPRFADKIQFSPFHWQCRTSIALYLEDFDFGITDQIVTASRAERKRRELA